MTFHGEQRARLDRARAILGSLRATRAPFTRTTVLEPLNELALELSNVGAEAGLFAEVHPDQGLRTAAEAIDRECAQLRTEILQDAAVLAAVRGVDPAGLDPLAQRVRELVLRDMRRSGAELGPAERERVRTLRDELLELGQEFSRNIRDDVRSIEVDDADLVGLPADWIAAHPTNAAGKRTITTDYPDAIPFMSYSASEEARRRLAFENLNRAAPRNLEVLGAMLAKRAELARLLGYPTWADFATADKMAGSAAAVRDFIARAFDATRESGAAERERILTEKRKADPGARAIGQWEHAYWIERIKAESFRFDPRSVRPYFEYRAVKAAVIDLASRLFGLTFTPVEQPGIWHPSVDTYAVTVDGKPMGRISLDMHPREGKFKHAACFTWRSGVGGKQEPHSVLVCNFPDPAAQPGPALMDHGEVVTFFHEFGHLVHNIVRGGIPWVRVGGVTEWDFVEAPSQFLEEWIFDAGVLRGFAKHVESGEAIPADLVARLREARDFGRAMFWQRQLFLSAVALELHQREPAGIDTTAVVRECAERYSPTRLLPDTHFEASFGHLEGYDASYYTYAYSQVISRDMLTGFPNGLMDIRQARRYRDLVLAAGGTKPAAQLVTDFLGRPYSFDAFAEWLAPR